MKLAKQRGSPQRMLLVILVFLAGGMAAAENMDPDNDDSQKAWAENVGWINAEPNGDDGDGIQVGDNELSGWMWSENTGWISLSCKNTLSCATTDYGILNDGNGVLTGYGWGENVGWINFAPSTSGVTIDPATGEFTGYAWAENVGWISFNCANTATCGDVDYKVKAGWICDPPPLAPTGSAELLIDRADLDVLLSWTVVGGATGSDIVYGELNSLRATAGDFTASTLGCIDDNRTTTSMLQVGTPAPGDGFWFLVRGQNCGGNGSYGDATRDAAISGSGNDCP